MSLPETANSFHNTNLGSSWSAICRGAVLKGMNDATVINHISKYHYGIRYEDIFDNRKHNEADKFWDMVECKWKANDQMRWYISRGDNISKTDPIVHHWYRVITDEEQLEEVTTMIHYCTAETAPKTLNSNVRNLCKLTAHFSPETYYELPQKRNPNGVVYRKLNYSIEMKVTSSGLDWMLHYEGQEKGRATIATDYTGNNPTNENN